MTDDPSMGAITQVMSIPAAAVAAINAGADGVLVTPTPAVPLGTVCGPQPRHRQRCHTGLSRGGGARRSVGSQGEDG